MTGCNLLDFGKPARQNGKRLPCERLMAENAKLRELVQELCEGCMDSPCEDCPLKGKPACADCPIFAREVAVIDHMHELGIEVDE